MLIFWGRDVPIIDDKSAYNRLSINFIMLYVIQTQTFTNRHTDRYYYYY